MFSVKIDESISEVGQQRQTPDARRQTPDARRQTPNCALTFRSFLRIIIPHKCCPEVNTLTMLRSVTPSDAEKGRPVMIGLADRTSSNRDIGLDGVEGSRHNENFSYLNCFFSAPQVVELEALLVADGGAKEQCQSVLYSKRKRRAKVSN